MVALKKGLRDISVSGSRILDNFRQIPRNELKRLVQQFFRENRVRRENVVLGVPREQTVVRFLSLPAEVKNNLPQVVRFQVESFEPSEENGSYYDYAVLEETTGEGARLSIILVLIKKAFLDEYLALFKELQIPLQSIQFSTFAIWNLLLSGQDRPKQDVAFVLNFIDGHVELVGLRADKLACTRFHRISGKGSLAQELLAEMENALSAARIPADGVDRILVAGSEAESMRQLLSADISDIGVLTSKVRLRTPIALNATLPNLATPIGLALEGLNPGHPVPLNIVPGSMRVKHSRVGYMTACTLLIALGLLAAGYFGREFYQERIFLTQLEDEIASLKPQVEEVDAIRKETQAVEEKIKYVQSLFCASDQNLELLAEMTSTIPDDTYLFYYSNRDGDIMFQGISQSASALLPMLSKSRHMKNLEPQSSFTRDPVSGKERFSMKARVEAQPCK